MSALIWCLLKEADSLEEITGRVAIAFHTSTDDSVRLTESALCAFDREGLFSCNGPVNTRDRARDDKGGFATPTGMRLIEPKAWILRRFFRTQNHRFGFFCQSETLGQEFVGYMSHLECRDPDPCDTHLSVVPGRGAAASWDIYLDDRAFKQGLPENQVIPQLATLLFVRACESLNDHLLFHAAVLQKNGITVLLPGQAGSGKTTLAAALTSYGWIFLSDEIAVLGHEGAFVSALPLPMSIKQGSLALLSRYYPALSRQPVHLRADGTLVRYFSPSSLPEDLNAQVPVKFLIFPRYIRGARVHLNDLDEMEALKRLTSTGSSDRELTSRDVETIIDLVENSSRYELIVGDLDETVVFLERRLFGTSTRVQAASGLV